MNLHYNFITNILDIFFVKKSTLTTRIEKQDDGWLVIADYGNGTIEKSLMPTENDARNVVGDIEFTDHREALRAVWYRRPWSKKRKALLAQANRGFEGLYEDEEKEKKEQSKNK